MADESEQMAADVQKALSGTRYECVYLERLKGGMNFIFKGRLKEPLSDGIDVVAIKHGEAFTASNASNALSTSRCVSLCPIEESNTGSSGRSEC